MLSYQIANTNYHFIPASTIQGSNLDHLHVLGSCLKPPEQAVSVKYVILNLNSDLGYAINAPQSQGFNRLTQSM